MEIMMTQEASEYLGISKSTLYRICKRKLLPFTRTIGGQRRFTKEDLDNFSKKCTDNNYADNDDYHNYENITDWMWEWDFKSNNTKIYTHGLHTYPAMFIPQLARKIIKQYSKEGDNVLDIFSGSGTTLVESKLLNRNSYGIELNPLAVLISKVKTTPIKSKYLYESYKIILEKISKRPKVKQNANFHNKDFWFREDISNDLDLLKYVLESINDKDIRDFFFVCMSEIIKKASFSKNGEFKLVRDKKKLGEKYHFDVIGEFKNIAERNIEFMDAFEDEASKDTTSIIYHNNSMNKVIQKESMDLILTSPPYGDSRTTVAYGQFSKLSSYYLGLIEDKQNIDNDLLGGKPISDNTILQKSMTLKMSVDEISRIDEKRAKDVISFYKDLDIVIERSYEALKRDKYFILVTGNRTVKNIVLRTDIIISELAAHHGFTTNGILFRNIPNKRMPAQNCPTNVKGNKSSTMVKESIIFLRKTD